ncbi:hypothetical protein SELMODRAFT_430043 [Selaginella moellendorffii]|uniref:Glycine-rich protein n=1 Tax=Selaginella moellendorffii TaxID=88036 RepID=D8T854_SELML|nr:chorion class B protein L11 [Selaginella moellendorffii]EFJ07154.1 hypothetical protein SELMODRAFT_430043 [Selaginella moellendorffii]|eukprot:XP_002991750.1 chorion class B protein L11 [Selaginella moellendorffii]
MTLLVRTLALLLMLLSLLLVQAFGNDIGSKPRGGRRELMFRRPGYGYGPGYGAGAGMGGPGYGGGYGSGGGYGGYGGSRPGYGTGRSGAPPSLPRLQPPPPGLPGAFPGPAIAVEPNEIGDKKFVVSSSRLVAPAPAPVPALREEVSSSRG